jgi:hypothetical protein
VLYVDQVKIKSQGTNNEVYVRVTCYYDLRAETATVQSTRPPTPEQERNRQEALEKLKKLEGN